LPSGTNSQAVGVLLGIPSTQALPINYKSTSWLTIGNFSQYLFVKDHSGVIAEKLGSGQPLRGIGVFGRIGYCESDFQQTARILALCFCTRVRSSRLAFCNSKYCFDSSTSMFGCAHAHFLSGH
jgi:hypothetical protein